MNNFNFDTTFTKGKHTFKIINNDVFSNDDEWLKINASNANALIEHWIDQVILPQVDRSTPTNLSFDNLVKEVSYIHAAMLLIARIKAFNCSYRNKSREDLVTRTYSLENEFYKKIAWKNLSIPQVWVLKTISDRDTGVSSWELQELYNPVTDDTTKLKKWYTVVKTFNYQKYQLSTPSEILATYKSVLKNIENFKIILREAGNDLINWGNQKVTLRFTKLGIKCNAYEIGEYLSIYKQHLTQIGILPVDKKKFTAKGKLDEKVKGSQATQDEYWRYYKQTPNATQVLNKLDLEHLFKIMDSELKCIHNKFFDRFGLPTGELKEFISILCEKSVTKQDYKRIVSWATPERVNLTFMIKHKEQATISDVIKFCKDNNFAVGVLIDEDFYQTCLTKIPEKIRYTLSTGLTYQYMVRMNESDKIKMLKWMDTTKTSFQLNYLTLFKIYEDVVYGTLKNTIIKNKEFLCHLSMKLVKENDHDAMVICATSVGNELSLVQKQGIFNKLSYEEKKKVIILDCGMPDTYAGSNSFTGAIKGLNEKECLDLLENLINNNFANNYITVIFNTIQSKDMLTKVNVLTRCIENPDTLPLNTMVFARLNVTTKIELLKKGISLCDEETYHSYYNKSVSTSKSLGLLFFKDFKREDIENVCDSPVHSTFKKYLAHTMTKNELELCANNEIKGWSKDSSRQILQKSFFRYNLDLFSYSFLKQFKEKHLFKIAVGDRRDRLNNFFGSKLLSKMKVSNSIDFMFDD